MASSGRPWSEEDLQRFAKLLRENGGRYAEYMAAHFPGRTSMALLKQSSMVRSRWNIPYTGSRSTGARVFPTVKEENWASPDNKPSDDVPEHWRATRAALSDILECEHGTPGCPGRGEKHACITTTETRVSMPVAVEPPKPKTPQEAGGEFIRARAQRDREQELRAANEHLLKELKDAEEQILVLRELRNQKPFGPIVAPPMPSGKRRIGTPVMLCSDWHVEESVESAKVNGLNVYNPTIAEKCIGEMAEAFEWLCRDPRWDMREAIVWLGGDLFSGYIHAELQETNFMSPVQAVSWLQERIERMLRTILATTQFERILVPTSDGNHGRLTQKMRCSTRTANSLEWLLYQTLAARLSDEPRIQFQINEGEYNYVSVYGRDLMFFHGDSVRYQGGVGGLLIPMRRGLNEIRKYRPVSWTNFGHFHQGQDLPDMVGNGSMIGINPYSMSIKASPEPPQQRWYVVDSVQGKCMSAPIWFSGRQ